MLPRSISAKHVILILIIIFPTSAIANTDFQACFQQLQQGTWGLQGAVDYWGNPVTNLTQASGLTYQACLNDCGPGAEAFDWVFFSQKFAAWVLPYLALISQIPYGASADRLSNFEAIMMTVGSPMLAAYSLILAVTSNRWMVRRFGQTNHRNAYFAAVVLEGLQQVSLRLAGDEITLPSLMMLKENDKFWRILARGLEYSTPRWNLPAIFSMLFVAISYIFTWIQTVRYDSGQGGPASGLGFGSLWLALIPIVLCNLQLSPKTDLKRIYNAVTNAQRQSRVTIDGSAQQFPYCNPLGIRTASLDPVDEDIVCPAPVCYYARIFEWFNVSREIRGAFEADLSLALEMDKQSTITKSNSAENWTLLRDGDQRRSDNWWDLLLIISRSIILATLLHWGTIGAAVMTLILTPTPGLSCWSGSYLLYAILGTVVWLLAFVSSIFAHIYSTSKASRSSIFTNSVRTIAITLRIAAKTIAGLNVVWIFMFIFFQFAGTYSTCYCNSCVISLGPKAYAVMTFSAAQIATVASYWTAGMLMSAGTAVVFIIAFNILRQRPEMPLDPLVQDQEQQTQDNNSSYSPVESHLR